MDVELRLGLFMTSLKSIDDTSRAMISHYLVANLADLENKIGVISNDLDQTNIKLQTAKSKKYRLYFYQKTIDNYVSHKQLCLGHL